MNPNILFLVIDSFRADKFSGSNKSSLTPNIDKMIQNGAYFKQAISSADGTPLSLASIFTAKLGANISHSISEKALKVSFGIFLIVVGILVVVN